MKRNPIRGECASVITTPGARANPAVSASRLVSAALLFGAVVMAQPGLLEAVVESDGEVRDALIGLLDCVNEHEAVAACPPVRITG